MSDMKTKLQSTLDAIDFKPLKQYEKHVPKDHEISYGMSGMFIKKPGAKYAAHIKTSEVRNDDDFKKAMHRELDKTGPAKKPSSSMKLPDLSKNWDKYKDV